MSTLITPLPKGFVDFKEIKSQVSISDVLTKYEILDSLKEQGDRLSGPCPIHQGSNVTQFRVSKSKNCFNCFGRCGRGGNVVDFVSLMEGVTFRDAALLLKDWFLPNQEEPKSHKEKPQREFEPKIEVKGEGINHPLSFTLKTLDYDHPYMEERGLSDEAIRHFGLGYCKRGCLKNHVVIPIHNSGSELVGYVGRNPLNDSDQPKYRFPKGFKKSLELFNIHHALQEPDDLPLVLVEGFFDCFALWEAGIKKCVALMGSNLSEAQADLLRNSLAADSSIEVLLDCDEAGKRGSEKICTALENDFPIRVIELPEAGMQPDHLDFEALASLFE